MNLDLMAHKQPAPPVLNLKKNDILDLTKAAPALKNVILGAGWDVAETGPSFDLDISAFLVDGNNKVANVATDVVFFNQMSQRGIKLLGDNRSGAGDGDDERIIINLNDIEPRIQRIVFFVTIFDAAAKQQTFGMVNNSFVRLLDADDNERELCRFELKETVSTCTAITFAELFKTDKGWSFKAIGNGSVGDLNTLISAYM